MKIKTKAQLELDKAMERLKGTKKVPKKTFKKKEKKK